MSWGTILIVLQVLLYVIIIGFLFYLWYVATHPPVTPSDDISECDSLIEGELPPSAKIERREDFNIIDEQRIFLSNAKNEYSIMKTMDFKTFTVVVDDEIFLESYCKSIKISFALKLKRYRGFLKKILQDIKSYESKNGGFNFVVHHDSSYERNKFARAEITSIIDTIRYKIKNLEINKIRANLKRAINDTKSGFNSLVGRDDVKNTLVRTIFSFSRSPQNFINNHNNYCIVGRAGVGKTKLAESMAFIFRLSGLLARGTISKVNHTDLTSAYVSESEQITRNKLFQSLEGILHLEEIYALSPSKVQEKFGMASHGKNALDEIVYFVDAYVGLGIVIASGYKNEMENKFFGPNEGMRRRFPNYIHLQEYDSKSLTNIFLEFFGRNCPEIRLTKKEEDYIYTLVSTIYYNKPELFKAQAGSMLNLSAKIGHAVNSSIEYLWDSRNWEANKKLIEMGFNGYLAEYNLSIGTKDKNDMVQVPQIETR